MPTRKLVLAALEVDSFPTTAQDGREGTVHAHSPVDAAPARCTWDHHTCTCPVYPSCAGNETCLYTECVSCAVPVTTVAGCVDAAETG